ncbi:MAG: MltA domain-containing protein [Elusimicrobia bacterium]|nr:MltA domain-containing protein [Elusimicrobiota bacterium]
MRRRLASRTIPAFLLAAIAFSAAHGKEPSKAASPVEGAELAVATGAVSASTAALSLRLVPAAQWPPIEDQLGKKGLLKAASRASAYLDGAALEKRFYRIGNKEVATGELVATVQELVAIVKSSTGSETLSERLRESFDLYQSVGSDGMGRVLFTAYYQPILSASLKPSKKYRFPLYRKPPDMVEVDVEPFNSRSKGEKFVGRVTKDKKLVPYFDRRAIDVRHVLAGKGLEIAWLENQYDRLDLHIQGSGILKFPSGKRMLARYAATNGLPYKSYATTLLNSGAISRAEMSHARLRQYLADHPEGESWILSQNPRYTFFELVPLPGDGEPYGTAQQQLVPGRSIAIDPAVIPLGALAYFQTVMPQADRRGNLLGLFSTSRLALCLDTGGAILGPGRVDIYLGSGSQAKVSAQNQWSEGKLYILLKKIPERDR